MHVIICYNITSKIAHSAGTVKTAPDFLCRLELKVTEKVRLKIQEHIQTTYIEITTSSSEVPDEEQLLSTQANKKDKSEKQTHEKKEQSRQTAKQWIANEEPPSLKTKVKESTKFDGNTTSCSMNGTEANAQLRVEQDVDLVIKIMKLKILGQPHRDLLITTDSRFKHYMVKEDHIIPKDGPLFRTYCGETGTVNNYQILILKPMKYSGDCTENLENWQ